MASVTYGKGIMASVIMANETEPGTLLTRVERHDLFTTNFLNLKLHNIYTKPILRTFVLQ